MKTSPALEQNTTEKYWHDAEELRWAVRHWAVKIGVKAPNVHLRQMKRKWASISTKGRLTLDVGLVQIPQKLGEYVIVHELLHLIAPNHGKVFKSFLYAYVPDWGQREKRLQEFSKHPKLQSNESRSFIK